MTNILQQRGNKDQGVYYERIAKNRKHGFNDTEEAFLKTWNARGMRSSRDRIYGVNLFSFLCRPEKPEFGLKKVTWRDRLVAATIIQWLGSNCGICFLRTALQSCGYDIVPVEKEVMPPVCKICEDTGVIPNDRYGAGRICQCKRTN